MPKTILITGSSTGIGRVAAEYFQLMGWNVAATMRHPEREQELNKLENIRCIQLDVTNEDSIQAAIDETIKHFGDLDAVVNNAGYGAVGPFEAATTQQVRGQFETNVFGLMAVIRHVLPHFRKNRKGTIVNITSIGGRMSWPLYSLYHASKWAVEGFSESLQYELRPFGIRVKVVEPFATQTDFFGRSQEFIENPSLTAYASYVDLCMPNLQKKGANGIGPEEVAAEIYKAVTDESNRLRYTVGRDANRVLFFQKFLPPRMFNWLVRKLVERKEDRLSKYRESE
jgi:short-subunit dehydrogenase